MDTKSTPTVRELYPNLSETELAEAEDNLERYIALVLRIFERTEMEAKRKADTLTVKTGTLACTPPGTKSAS